MGKLSSPHIGWHVIFGQVVTKLDFVIITNCISGQLELTKKKKNPKFYWLGFLFKDSEFLVNNL